MSGLLFVTAPSADHKVINRLLLHLRDWEFESDDRFHLVTTKNAYDLDKSPEDADVKETTPPVPADLSNAWKDSSLADVEAFVLDLSKSGTEGVSSSIYVLVDEKGLQNQTCVLAERRYDDENEQEADDFNKVRVPWDQAYIMWCNLDIANVGFEEYCDQDAVADENGWWKLFDDPLPLSDEKRGLRDEAIKKLEDDGKA